MGMDTLRPHLDLLHPHLYAAVFVSSVIDATGVPFPGRALLVLAGALAMSPTEISTVIALAVVGAVLGDHGLYLGGRARGGALLSLYCRVTCRSADCVERALGVFTRYGSVAIALGRFSTIVRLFAAVLAGGGGVSYGRFLAYDLAGTILYSSLWALLGHLFGAQVVELIFHLGPLRALFLVGAAAIVVVVAYRAWRRRAIPGGTPLACPSRRGSRP
jgi:membrane protein DedA with SNARE-associated domain